MAVTQYIGARYVPLIEGDWDNSRAYEPLSVVTYLGNSYTSKQAVPIGAAITDQQFWVQTGNYNAQVEAYRQQVERFDGRITENSEAIETEREAREELSARLDSVADKSDLGSYFIVPDYVGSFTLYNGKYQSASGSINKPMFPQGMTMTNDDEFFVIAINSDESNANYVTASMQTNSWALNSGAHANWGHSNSVTYNPTLRRFYINDGSAHIIVANENLATIATLDTPDGSTTSEMVYDKVTEKMFLVSYGWNIFEFDPDANSFTDTGIALDPWVTGGVRLGQGAALYDNYLVFPVGKNNYGSGLRVYDIRTGKLYADYTFPSDNGLYPIAEPEDCEFSSDGILYMSTTASYFHSDEFCRSCIIFKLDIFNGELATFDKTYQVEPDIVHVECANYNGFYSDGTPNYPHKTLDELSLSLAARQKTRLIRMGVDSNHSTTREQTWFGYLWLSGTNASLIFNASNNITIMGGIKLQANCVLSLRNRYQFAPMFNKTSESAIVGSDSIVLAGPIVCVPSSDSGSNGTIGNVIQMTGSGMIRATRVDGLDAGATGLVGGINGGYGYVVGAIEREGELT